MFYRNLLKLILATTVISFLASGTAFGRGETVSPGSGLPDYYPASFQNTGVINGVSGSSLNISGLNYSLSPNVLIHSTMTEHSSRYDLGSGKEVGFTVDNNRNTRTITEIWILPSGTVRLH